MSLTDEQLIDGTKLSCNEELSRNKRFSIRDKTFKNKWKAVNLL